MNYENIPLVGAEITDPPQPVFELRLADHVPTVNPADYGIVFEFVDPHRYYVTSGDAVEKTKILDRDMWRWAGRVRAALRGKKGAEKRAWKKFEKAVWQAAGRSRKLLMLLCAIRGKNVFLEQEWNDRRLLVIPKNPRARPTEEDEEEK